MIKYPNLYYHDKYKLQYSKYYRKQNILKLIVTMDILTLMKFVYTYMRVF